MVGNELVAIDRGHYAIDCYVCLVACAVDDCSSDHHIGARDSLFFRGDVITTEVVGAMSAIALI